jgi:ankyrin repeat protein
MSWEKRFEEQRLHRAADAGDLAAVQELLRLGRDVNAFDEIGKTPLHYAVLGEHFEIVDWLLRHGAKINAQDERVIGDTPLGEAASSCSLRMARLLITAGADPTVRGWMHLNALDRAQSRKRSEGISSEGHAVFMYLKEMAKKMNRRKK